MKILTKTICLAILVIVLAIPLLTSGCSLSRSRVSHREIVSDTLKNFINYQEEADVEKVVSLVVADQQEVFRRNLKEATRDDMIQSAIRFREENYQLQEVDEKVAVFWSELSKSYLVLTLEDSNWLINPQATDEMNN